jgi:hypothetical protein
VVKWYKLWDELERSFPSLNVEKGPNTPFIAGQIQLGKFDLLLICPSTGNTTAKVDTLAKFKTFGCGVSGKEKWKIRPEMKTCNYDRSAFHDDTFLNN